MDEKQFRSRVCKDLLAIYDSRSGFDLEDLDAFRKDSAAAEVAALKTDPEVRVYERMIPGPVDSPDIKLRIYVPMGRQESLPGMLFFHGGGFVFGSVYRQEWLCQEYCKQTKTVIISVDYRLAPEWKAPAAAEDGYAALCWVAENGAEIGVDPEKIGVIGVSGGGNVCAAVTLMARDRKGPQPRISMPLYAELDCRFITKSSREIDTPKVWSYRYSVISWRYYLTQGEESDYYASPSLCENLSGLPPTFGFVGSLDPFLDENLDYWRRMLDAGADVEYHVYPGCFHGFDLSAPNSVYGAMALRATCSYICRAMYPENINTIPNPSSVPQGAPA